VRLIFEVVRAGGVDDAVRLEPGGDLNQYGTAFNGRVPTPEEARAADGLPV
jgi:hypothetical protein